MKEVLRITSTLDCQIVKRRRSIQLMEIQVGFFFGTQGVWIIRASVIKYHFFKKKICDSILFICIRNLSVHNLFNRAVKMDLS